MIHESTRRMVYTALLIALVLLLGLTPIGMIPLGFIYISILAIPVVIGTLYMGLKTGLALGFCFGTISALSAFGITGAPSSLVAPLVAASPLLTLLMCYVPRLLVPVVAHYVYMFASRWEKNEQASNEKKAGAAGLIRRIGAMSVSAIAGSLTNTVFYLGLMLLFYLFMGIDSTPILALIGGTGLISGSLEALANAVISPAVLTALWKSSKK